MNALAKLYVKPSEFFADAPSLIGTKHTLVATWVVGIASAIERIDRLLTMNAAGGRQNRVAESLSKSWTGFWLFVVFVGILTGWLLWSIAGWWYRKRLEWCRADEPQPELARTVWAWQSFVWAMPMVILTAVQTFTYRDYAAVWSAQDYWIAIVLLALAWSCVTSYVGATTAFAISRGRAALWFLALPLAVYTVALTIGAVFAVGAHLH